MECSGRGRKTSVRDEAGHVPQSRKDGQFGLITEGKILTYKAPSRNSDQIVMDIFCAAGAMKIGRSANLPRRKSLTRWASRLAVTSLWNLAMTH